MFDIARGAIRATRQGRMANWKSREPTDPEFSRNGALEPLFIDIANRPGFSFKPLGEYVFRGKNKTELTLIIWEESTRSSYQMYGPGLYEFGFYDPWGKVVNSKIDSFDSGAHEIIRALDSAVETQLPEEHRLQPSAADAPEVQEIKERASDCFDVDFTSKILD